LAYDYVNVASTTLTVPRPGYQSAAAAYLLVQATDKLSFNSRVDYFSQSQYLTSPGMPEEVLALTETVQYDLWKNVVSRLEFRWDHSLNGTEAYGGGTTGNPGPSLKNAFLLAANIIYKF
jgi:hypothetical protein